MCGLAEKWTDILSGLTNGSGPISILKLLALQASIYFIWRERNNRILGDSRLAPVQLFMKIRDMVLLRMAWRNRRNSVLRHV